MKTRSYLQRRTNAESSDLLSAKIQPHPNTWQHEQPQPQAHDFSHVDLFSHAPQRGPIQMKLTVGAPNDRYEQEADRVADQVLNTPDSALQSPIQREEIAEEEELQMKPLSDTITPIVQREEIAEEEELQMKPSLQRQVDGIQADSSLEQQLSSSRGGGSPLPDNVRRFMEPRFGANFSQVRVHTGGDAVQMNQNLRAQAFTHKQDIYFGTGKAPGNDALTAHELTHVIQQTGTIANSSNPENVEKKK